jgi:hypothetical protein
MMFFDGIVLKSSLSEFTQWNLLQACEKSWHSRGKCLTVKFSLQATQTLFTCVK